MAAFIAVALAVLTFAFIAYPLFRQGSYAAEPSWGDRRRGASMPDTTYPSFKELESEHKAGVLTDEDYRDLEERYKLKAGSEAKDTDRAAAGGKEPRDIPEQDDIERQVQKLRKTRGRTCSKCGSRIVEGDRFCSGCGAGVGQGGQS